MAFGTETYTERPDAGKLPGKKQNLAVDCWFTSKGKTIPRMFKYQDEEGILHSVSGLRILCQEEKYYCGVPTLEYLCEVIQDQYRTQVKLIFLLEEHRWMLCP